MDLSKFAGLSEGFDKGVEIEILHPMTSKPTGLKVSVASYKSERVKRVERRIANQALREQARNPKRIRTVEEHEEKADEIIASAVVSWSGFEMKGKPLECTPENVLSVLQNTDLFFIKDQIDKAADDVTAFMTASGKN